MKVSQPTGSLCFPFVSIEYLHGPTGKKSKQTGVKKLFPPDLAIVNFIILKLLTLYILISIQQKKRPSLYSFPLRCKCTFNFLFV